MPRCRKVLASGKRCKASALAGSKFCLFHTPGQRMNRKKKKTDVQDKEVSRGEAVARRSVENQLAIRSSKKLANYTAAYGAYLQTRPDSYLYTRENPARYHKSGTRYVGATTSRMTIHHRSDGGRNFRATDGSRKARLAMGRHLVWGGRLIPILGYAYVGYNMYRDPVGTTQDMAPPWIVTDTESMGYQVTKDIENWFLYQVQNAKGTPAASRGYQTRGGVL